MNLLEYRFPLQDLLSHDIFEVSDLRVNGWRWAGHGMSNLIIPKDSKILIEITGTGQLRVYRP